MSPNWHAVVVLVNQLKQGEKVLWGLIKVSFCLLSSVFYSLRKSQGLKIQKGKIGGGGWDVKFLLYEKERSWTKPCKLWKMGKWNLSSA